MSSRTFGSSKFATAAVRLLNLSVLNKVWPFRRDRHHSRLTSQEQFESAFAQNLTNCSWAPHPGYSVFTQFDAEYYLSRREAFLEKYRSFYAVSKTISPGAIIELGVGAGAGADAYLSACPDASYTGIDTFGEPWPANDQSPWNVLRKDDDSPWKPYDIATRLLEDRGFKKFQLITANLRHLERLPHTADLVVVMPHTILRTNTLICSWP